jgi:hypothetical protein
VRIAVQILEEGPAGFDNDLAPVPREVKALAAPLSLPEDMLLLLLESPGVAADEFAEMATEDLMARPAIDPLRALVPIDDATVKIVNDYGILGAGKKRRLLVRVDREGRGGRRHERSSARITGFKYDLLSLHQSQPPFGVIFI